MIAFPRTYTPPAEPTPELHGIGEFRLPVIVGEANSDLRSRSVALPKRSAQTLQYWCRMCTPISPIADHIIQERCPECTQRAVDHLEGK